MTQESILSKIKKLQDSSTSYSEMGNAQAARLYAEKVQSLLIKHKLSMAAVDAADDGSDPMDEEIIVAEGVATKRRTGWADILAGVVARAHFCDVFSQTGRAGVTIVGRKSDREIATFMFHYLVRNMREAAKAEKVFADNHAGFEGAFYRGFTRGVADRYTEIKKAAQAECAPTALVSISKAATLWMEKKHNLRRTARTYSRRNSGASQAGFKHGRSADLGKRGIKSGSKQGQIS